MIPLFVSSIQIILFLIVLLGLVITSLVFASKNENNIRFLIWGAIILFVPFVGAVAYLIKHYTSKKIA
ncbi:hypothetical protein [Polaribacter sargassicola]|uniref:hypothetical protein n=1 Tax=Polaribacter sargassicola TaxID=2836891 RepID=UPI001F1F4C8F|nr:hypothetical protein [Polaribacter sp. DS7-9]MCG1035064.1 hypothetical protein [Polaribacter sp. DS7-9]